MEPIASPEEQGAEDACACCEEDACCEAGEEAKPQPQPQPQEEQPQARAYWARVARALAWVSVVWNVAEGASAIYYGVERRQLALLGWGAQSGVEVGAACLVLYRIGHGFGKPSREVIEVERRATRVIGVLLVLLALLILLGSVDRLVERQAPSNTLPGMIISSVSALAMFALWRLKVRAGRELGSEVILQDAYCSLACLQLSMLVIGGSAIWFLNRCHTQHCRFWYLDAALALLLGLVILRDGVRVVRATLRQDFAGGCACCSGLAPPVGYLTFGETAAPKGAPAQGASDASALLRPACASGCCKA
jgi:hypothetical protein